MDQIQNFTDFRIQEGIEVSVTYNNSNYSEKKISFFLEKRDSLMIRKIKEFGVQVSSLEMFSNGKVGFLINNNGIIDFSYQIIISNLSLERLNYIMGHINFDFPKEYFEEKREIKAPIEVGEEIEV
ncbi:MAG: hypothetical protein UR25_C0002G0023 [Candidatus Nomurabacteria bacterium GW2011_GWE1_32_28]|uniref:Uncharacterized protein n=1 Tax=Candidatus Nomurabacteria bacterium GW2011_GWF1_31_48 TaxID=1618767 RepID=A0A0G0BHH7_9BACT|nr:MAG: hypothetical protein UR10_C0002G0023 [Candidatus Nomurabacteria bacterium GW2011_GWF2_30_133]KKP29088.1 MAG: hypothetical protein UR18_C0001G0209 [Candidatus Nomurabacteria bacterium GW2011_GWE2_31_40]KKP30502.1 MAG: hypothetical protein UR19_C0002G0023 [Candidatus Nomurabacteria bacterium GW2011_GWF1_31_48]KKP34987.1 MAG: hypothetical protein UR25_C0002G0023 [Candidatus Nomurabacteria bacterium GW2011_GWE1_32_28]HAS80645.1 hypothetical protein [Candidatus Nomurabacteria bacterium]